MATITPEELQQVICSLNDSSPLYDDIRSLVIKEYYVTFLYIYIASLYSSNKIRG